MGLTALDPDVLPVYRLPMPAPSPRVLVPAPGDGLGTNAVCPACGCAEGFTDFTAREMQFGSREEFTYRECTRCSSLHIATVPADLARFYPADYYAFEALPPSRRAFGWGYRLMTRWLIASPDPIARLAARGLSYRRYAFFQWARMCGVRLDAKILDVGCGSGGLLRRMQQFGFTRLSGVDPYAPEEVHEDGFDIVRSERPPLGERYRLVMMHHVLEHLADPLQGLAAARDRLEPGGLILVRVPIAGSFIHRKYGADWFHLDAPRHLVIPSVQGMQFLAQRARLRVVKSGFDGGEPSFLMSESYRRDIPARIAPRPNRATRVRYRRWARRLNSQGEGDQGFVVLAAKDGK
jgi:SAM-dependent methyltransferase